MSVQRVSYSRDLLLSLRPLGFKPPVLSVETLVILQSLSISNVFQPTKAPVVPKKKIATSSIFFQHLNIRSLRSPEKFEVFETLLKCNDSPTKFFALTETFLDASHATRLYNIDGYHVHRKDRAGQLKKGGGGILFYTPAHITAKVVDHPDPPDSYETLFVEASFAGRHVLTAVVYRPPAAVER